MRRRRPRSTMAQWPNRTTPRAAHRTPTSSKTRPRCPASTWWVPSRRGCPAGSSASGPPTPRLAHKVLETVSFTWIATSVDDAVGVAAHDAGDVVVALTVTPSLERWTLHVPSATIHREILDSTRRRFAHATGHLSNGVPRFLWAAGDRTADKFDLATGGHAQHDFESRQPGDLAFVADSARANLGDGGWLVGFVHHLSGNQTDLLVLDAADIAQPPVATVRLPGRIPSELRTTWVHSTR